MNKFWLLPVLLIFISLVLSTLRLMGHEATGKEATPCAAFYIDSLEPAISTRWFCEKGSK